MLDCCDIVRHMLTRISSSSSRLSSCKQRWMQSCKCRCCGLLVPHKTQSSRCQVNELRTKGDDVNRPKSDAVSNLLVLATKP